MKRFVTFIYHWIIQSLNLIVKIKITVYFPLISFLCFFHLFILMLNNKLFRRVGVLTFSRTGGFGRGNQYPITYTLFWVLPKQATLIKSIFTQSSFFWYYLMKAQNIYVVQYIYLGIIFFVFYAFKNYHSSDWYFNFQKKVQLPLVIWRNIKFTKFSWLG